MRKGPVAGVGAGGWGMLLQLRSAGRLHVAGIAGVGGRAAAVDTSARGSG